MKKQPHFFSKILGIPTSVSRSQPSSTVPRTNTRVMEKKRNGEDDPALNALVPTLTHSIEVLPEEAGPGHCQQGASGHSQSMASKDESNTHGHDQTASVKSGSIHPTPQEPSQSKPNEHDLRDHRTNLGGLISAQRDQPPVQSHGYAADSSAATSIPTFRSANPEQRSSFRRSFHMVIHLAGGNTAMRVVCLDTGSTVDVISIDVVNSLNLPMVAYSGPPLAPIGDKFLPVGEVRFDWHVAKFNKTYTSTFVVIDEQRSMGFDVLLGEKTVGAGSFFIPNHAVFFQTIREDVVLSEASDTPRERPVTALMEERKVRD